MGELILLRHGETEWSRDGRHTGRTDIPLTPKGISGAAALAPMVQRRVAGQPIAAVFTSPAQRAVRTAELAGLGSPGVPGFDGGPAPKQDPDLWEWDYGGYEGITTAEIQRERPGWFLWRDGVIPGDAQHPGESAAQVGERVDRVLKRVSALLPRGTSPWSRTATCCACSPPAGSACRPTAAGCSGSTPAPSAPSATSTTSRWC